VPSDRWDGVRAALLAFGQQVLLRPTRIGTLLLLGGMIIIALVGAEGWWIVLGITLFQVAASTLIVMWVDLPRASSRAALDEVPQQRRPEPDE
jgi:hypothetical protein